MPKLLDLDFGFRDRKEGMTYELLAVVCRSPHA